jgi:gamma-glutamylcyclotransferase (GGCT)/AIG2-like uncharacterized protein YtfP
MSQLVTDEELNKILARLNTLRHSSSEDEWRGCCSVVEKVVETLFSASNHLAVYGSLAPGESNHHVIADVPGQWQGGYVHGQLYDRGWGSGLGYPAMLWQPEGPTVKVHLFVSPHLPRHWRRLDEFEGDGYRRSLVPVYGEQGIVAVANIYELRQ